MKKAKNTKIHIGEPVYIPEINDFGTIYSISEYIGVKMEDNEIIFFLPSSVVGVN